MKCFELIGDDKIRRIFEEFNKIGDKQKQDIYLAGLIIPQNVARRRSRTETGKEKEISFKYKVTHNIDWILNNTNNQLKIQKYSVLYIHRGRSRG